MADQGKVRWAQESHALFAEVKVTTTATQISNVLNVKELVNQPMDCHVQDAGELGSIEIAVNCHSLTKIIRQSVDRSQDNNYDRSSLSLLKNKIKNRIKTNN